MKSKRGEVHRKYHDEVLLDSQSHGMDRYGRNMQNMQLLLAKLGEISRGP